MLSRALAIIILMSAFICGSCEMASRKAITGDSVPRCREDVQVASADCNRHKAAINLIVSGQYKAAEQKIQEIITSNPEFYGAYRTLGEILPGYIKTDTIAEFLNKLLEQNPANGYAHWAHGLLCITQGDYPAALEYFKQTIRLKPEFPDTYENLVDVYNKQGKIQEAVPALEVYSGDLQKEGSAWAEYGLAYLFFRLGKFKEASAYCTKLCTGTPPQAAGRLYKLAGTLYSIQKHSNTAFAYYECALKNFRAYGDIQGEMAALINLGTAYDQLLDYEKALEQYKQALPLAGLLQNPVYEGQLLMNTGIAYRNLDDYSNSFLYYQQALTHFRAMEAPDKLMLGSINNNLGEMHAAYSDYSRARDYYGTALELSREIQYSALEVAVLNNLGEVCKSEGDYNGSLVYYRQALGLQNKEDYWTKAVLLNNIGEIYAKTGQYREARNAFTQSLENRKLTGDRRGEGITIKNTGYLFYLEGKYNQALACYRKALQTAGKESAESAEITGEMGICCLALKQYNAARKFLEPSIGITEMLRSRLKYEKHKTGFMQNKKRFYDAMVELLYTMQQNGSGRPEDDTAFEYSEKAKARTLLNLLEENRIEIKKGISPELAVRRAEIDRAYSLKSTQLGNELKKPVKQENRVLVNSLAKELKQLENEYADVLTRATLENSLYGQMVYSRPVSVAQIQESLPDTATLLIAYQVTENALYAWRIAKNAYAFSRLPLEQKVLKEKILYLYHLLAKPDKDEEYLIAASELYTLLIKPVLSPGSQYNSLIIIPDGILRYLPFEVLVSEEKAAPDAPAYLVREYNIQYVQSAAILYYLYNQKKSRDNENNKLQGPGAAEAALLAIGDPVLNVEVQKSVPPGFYMEALFRLQGLKPLPFSSREVQEIGGFFPRKLILSREAALEERIKQPGGLDGFTYIHFATHSIINETSSGGSGLVLTQDDDPREDGFLQVREIFNLETRAELVVLSACSTMLGEYIAGEGITGLTRAWMYAGAASVLASLWNIQDKSTAVFMTAFYRNLKAGLSCAAALRQAQLLLMAQDKYRHPYFWAGFVLTGEG